jgi:DNA-binding NtrC family response regulator
VKPTVLIVDDEKSLCGLLELFFEKKGYASVSVHDVAGAKGLLDRAEPILAMVDLSLGAESGLTVVKTFIGRWPRLPVIVMTAYGTVEKAVEAVKLGAFDFISKPFEMGFLAKVVGKAVAPRMLEEENRELKELIRRQGVELVGTSEPVRALRDRIDAFASTDSTVLITGESGTGKELVAKLIHQKSPRSAKPFVPVNCSALSENLLESELFGHVKGSFTSAHADKEGLFAVADGGTIFLDEVGEMPQRTQVKLLRVLQEREITKVGGTAPQAIDVRILSATNVDLEEAVAQGRFREDLYYRLNVLRVHTPSLSERGEDSVLLANHFLQRKAHGRKRFAPDALAQIRAYAWPGNVRQLENAVERAIAFSTGEEIASLELDAGAHPGSAGGGSGWVPAEGEGAQGGPGPGGANSAIGGSDPTLTDIERAYIFWVLTQHNWHKPTAAKILGLDISTLYRKIEKYGLKARA